MADPSNSPKIRSLLSPQVSEHTPASTEPLLDRTGNRFVIYPIQDQELWSMYRKALASFWVPGEVDLSGDIIDWKTKLNEGERHLLSYVLAFFAASDGIVNENLAARFMQEVTLPEARCFYGFQIMIENVHAETYASLVDTLIEMPNERNKMFNAIFAIDSVTDKAVWALKWCEDQSAPFALRLAAFAAVEGIMHGLCYANELISRDEGLHQEFACKLFQRLRKKPKKRHVTKMVAEAVEVEKRFIGAAMPRDLHGMNQHLMHEYIEFVADRLLLMLGYPKHFRTLNPFPFMDLISLQGKANFFERQVSSYRILGV